MKELIGKAPEIIREAGKSLLGLAAEIVLLLSVVALVFFSGGPVTVQVISFLALLTGLTLFAFAIARIYSNSGRAQTSDRKGTSVSLASGKKRDVKRNVHQAAAICFRHRGENLEFLLILNDSGTRRVFPKGYVKEDEALWAAAEREAREEAGVEGNIRREQLTLFWIHKGKKRPQEMAVAAFLLEATRKTWDHKRKRDPKWYSYQEALDALAENRDSEVASELKRVLRKAISDLSEA